MSETTGEQMSLLASFGDEEQPIDGWEATQEACRAAVVELDVLRQEVGEIALMRRHFADACCDSAVLGHAREEGRREALAVVRRHMEAWDARDGGSIGQRDREAGMIAGALRGVLVELDERVVVSGELVLSPFPAVPRQT